jgi:peroxiredoxin Q/BCP
VTETSAKQRGLVKAVSFGLLVVAVAIGTRAWLEWGPTKRPDGGEGLLAVGADAPEVVAEDPQGKPVKLSGLHGQVVAVYFYPKDETPGCTKQACAFRDAWDRLQSAGVHVIGVSRDDRASHREFAKHHSLPFPLAADADGMVQDAWGVPSKMPGISARVTFLVGRDGKVARVWPEVDPAVDAKNVLAAAAELPR